MKSIRQAKLYKNKIEFFNSGILTELTIMLQNGNYFWQMVTQAASKKRLMLSILSYKKPSLISYLKTK